LILLKAHLNWKAGRRLIDIDPDAAAQKLIRAVASRPTDDRRARRTAEMLLSARRIDAARAISESRTSNEVDKVKYWRHYDSFLNELQLADAYELGLSKGTFRIALFNDTDYRVNIGCRLTSQGLKDAIRRAFPGAAISSHGFNF
jgi:hypothetical protein